MKAVRVYIDGFNLRFGIEQSGWKLNYKSFRSWLRDKYGATEATLFLGLVPDKFELIIAFNHTDMRLSFAQHLPLKTARSKAMLMEN